MDQSEIKTCVPWFSLSEWKHVYKDLYNIDSQLQKRGYERLMMWKARVDRLPAGVECTLGFMQVRLQDEKVSKQILEDRLPLYAENDLRLIFSTAVMRFLNFIATLAQADDTLYTMAGKLNIPEWFVVLRHDAAHNSDLPSLPILRFAVDFGLEWLKENYWKESSQTLADWIIKDVTSNEKSVEMLMDIWQGLKIYELDGYIYVDELRDRKLREYLDELQPPQNKERKKKCVQLPSNELNDDNEKDENMETEEYEKRCKLKNAINAVRRTLLKVISEEKRKDKQGAVDKFVAQLVNSEAFIPSESFTNEMCAKVGEKLNGNDLPEWMRMFWKDLLVLLQKHHNMFPNIVHKLLKLFAEERVDHRQLFMALWIKELCLSMIKWKETKTLMSAEDLKSGQQLQIMGFALAKVERRFPHLTKVMLSISKDEAGLSCSLTDIQYAAFNPHKYTFLFIQSLLDVSSPSVSDLMKYQVKSLITIYTEGTCSSDIAEENFIYTENDLQVYEDKTMDLNETFDSEEPPSSVLLPSASSSMFVREYDWSMCPLGILPWQRDTLPQFDIPSEITWTRSQPETEEERENVSQQPVQEHIDWDVVRSQQSAIKKRLRVKKKLLENRMKIMKRKTTSF